MRTKTLSLLLLAMLVISIAFIRIGTGAQQTKQILISETYLGGLGDEYGTGIAISGGWIYISGWGPGYNDDGLIARYSLLPTLDWSSYWPNQNGPGPWDQDRFSSVAVSNEGVYLAGCGDSYASDGVGGFEGKSMLVKFPLPGATGPDVGGCTWYRSPNFFSYRGYENFKTVLTTTEGDSTYIYAAGDAQANGANNTAVLSKYDSNGNQLWWQILGDTGSAKISSCYDMAWLNGNLYIAGNAQPDWERKWAKLWKYDSAGNLQWSSKYTDFKSWASSVATLGDYIYVVGGVTLDGYSWDVLILKFDKNGDLLWSTIWGGAADDIAWGVATDGNWLYVVGETSSFGSGGKDVSLLVVDPAYGTVLAENFWGGAADDLAKDVTVGSYIYIVGETASYGAGGVDLVLLKYTRYPPMYTLNTKVNRPKAGTIKKNPDKTSYFENENVTLTAKTNKGYDFKTWKGDVKSKNRKDNPLTIVMDSYKKITAFLIPQYSLKLSAGKGGTTRPSPGKHIYRRGRKVTINAKPDKEFKFKGWSGDCSGRKNPRTIRMNSDKEVKAHFVKKGNKF